jgi:quercetin dioxygenase-like cupin family protein
MYQKVITREDVDCTALEIPGVTIQILHEDRVSGGTTVLTHLAAGATIPEHWHVAADETVFVLSGDFLEAGQAYGPGTFFVGKAGTSHGPHASNLGCTVLTTFSAPFDFQMGRPSDPPQHAEAL